MRRRPPRTRRDLLLDIGITLAASFGGYVPAPPREDLAP